MSMNKLRDDVCVQAMEALRDEVEELEEALVDSVKDAVVDKNKVGLVR